MTAFAITFSLAAAPAPLDSLAFEISYQGGGGFDGQAGAVACTRLGGATGATSTFKDDDLATLTATLTAGNTAMSAVSEIVRCSFSAEIKPTSGNFAVTVTKARDEDDNEVKNQTQVLVTSILEEGGGGDTDHFVTFRVTSAHTAVGALEFEVGFVGDQGAFAVLSGRDADCTKLAPNALVAAGVTDELLTIGLISTSGFSTPVDLARCRFVAATAPTVGDFEIDVVGATTVSGDPIDPDVVVSSITTGSQQ